MTPDEELRRYLDEAAAEPLLSPGAERRLMVEMRGGQTAARDRLVRANMRLVVSIAQRYQNQGRKLSALVRDGHAGLERAVDGFDPSKGYKLSTYATWFIRQAIGTSPEGEASS
jgi:RNA polymerase primary sigma factor